MSTQLTCKTSRRTFFRNDRWKRQATAKPSTHSPIRNASLRHRRAIPQSTTVKIRTMTVLRNSGNRNRRRC